MKRELGIEVVAVNDAKEAVDGADIVAACTNSLDPVLKGEWLSRGAHATKVNANELDEKFFEHVDVIVKHQVLETKRYVAGMENELAKAPKAVKKGKIKAPEEVPTLSELVLGLASGRVSSEQVTFFDNNEGSGLQFAACGALVYQRALERGLGHELPSEWFLQDIRD